MEKERIQPGQLCWCGSIHNKCIGHVVECSECEWSGGNVDPEVPCVKCGGQCIRRICKRPPTPGTTVCPAHGVNERTKNAAKRNVTKAKVMGDVRRQLGIGDLEPITNPYELLASLSAEIVAVKDVLREKVEQLDTLRTSGGQGFSEQLDVLMSAYGEWINKAERIANSMAKLDISDRALRLQLRIDENYGRMIGEALEAALSSVALEPEQRSTILATFGARLRGQERAALPS